MDHIGPAVLGQDPDQGVGAQHPGGQAAAPALDVGHDVGQHRRLVLGGDQPQRQRDGVGGLAAGGVVGGVGVEVGPVEGGGDVGGQAPVPLGPVPAAEDFGGHGQDLGAAAVEGGGGEPGRGADRLEGGGAVGLGLHVVAQAPREQAALGPPAQERHQGLDPLVVVLEDAGVAVFEVEVPDHHRVRALPHRVHQVGVVGAAPVEGRDHRQVAVRLLGVGQVVEPFRPERERVEGEGEVAGHRVAEPADPLGPVGRVLGEPLHRGGEGPGDVAVDPVDQLVGAFEAPGLGHGGAGVPGLDPLHGHAGIASDFGAAEAVEGEPGLPDDGVGRAAQDVLVGLAGAVVEADAAVLEAFVALGQPGGAELGVVGPGVHVRPVVEAAVGPNAVAVADRHPAASRAGHPQPGPPGQVLAEIVDGHGLATGPVVVTFAEVGPGFVVASGLGARG